MQLYLKDENRLFCWEIDEGSCEQLEHLSRKLNTDGRRKKTEGICSLLVFSLFFIFPFFFHFSLFFWRLLDVKPWIPDLLLGLTAGVFALHISSKQKFLIAERCFIVFEICLFVWYICTSCPFIFERVRSNIRKIFQGKGVSLWYHDNSCCFP